MRICFIIRVCIICSILAQIPCLEKNVVPEIWAKMLSANQIAEFSNHLYLLNKLMKWPDYLLRTYYQTNLHKFIKIKTWWERFWLGMVKNVSSHFGHETLKLVLSQKWINWLFANDFFGGCDQKLSFSSLDSKSCCILRTNLQKQPPKGVLRKRFSENIQQIYRGTPMPKCNFNKVAKQLY